MASSKRLPKMEKTFGITRLIEAIERNTDKPLQESLNTIFDEVITYTAQGRQQDDIAFIAFEVGKE